MLNKKITIAIDGFSSTGKSTLAKELANHLGYVYIDTGAMYRAVTLFAMQNKIIGPGFFYKDVLEERLTEISLLFKFNEEVGHGQIYLNGKSVENEIRNIEVANYVSLIAEIPAVRAKLVQQQQEMGRSKGIVMDGRDIGTVVFPDAELKIFMTASANTRAQRRFKEMQSKGDSITFDEVLKNVVERDYIDTHRNDSPLIKAHDAIEIDNSCLSKTEQFLKVLQFIPSL